MRIRIFVALLSMPCAAVTIHTVSLVERDATSLTYRIQGQGFGTGPSVVLYDSFERGQPNDLVFQRVPEVGRWPDDQQQQAIISSEEAYSGRQSAIHYAPQLSIIRGLIAGQVGEGPHGYTPFQEVFFSSVIRDKERYPCGQMSDWATKSCGKDKWLMMGDRGDTTYLQTQGHGHDLVLRTIVGGAFAIAGNNTRTHWWLPGGGPEWWEFQQWNRESFYAKLDSNNPYGPVNISYFQVVSPQLGVRHHAYTGTLMDEQEFVAPSWDRIKIGYWYADPFGFRYIDEIYMAIGPNAQARVVIGENESYLANSKFAIMIPLSWTDNEIVGKVYAMPDTVERNPVFYVIDSLGQQNYTGFRVRFPPAAIESLRIGK